jgi:hypothetical protein
MLSLLKVMNGKDKMNRREPQIQALAKRMAGNRPNALSVALTQAKKTLTPYVTKIQQKYRKIHNKEYITKSKNTNTNIIELFKSGNVINKMVKNINIHPNYPWTSYMTSNSKYKIYNKNHKIKAFATVKNHNNSREIYFIGAVNKSSGYGSKLLNKIIKNASNNKKKLVLHPASNRLVEFYKRKGFVGNRETMEI